MLKNLKNVVICYCDILFLLEIIVQAKSFMITMSWDQYLWSNGLWRKESRDKHFAFLPNRVDCLQNVELNSFNTTCLTKPSPPFNMTDWLRVHESIIRLPNVIVPNIDKSFNNVAKHFSQIASKRNKADVITWIRFITLVAIFCIWIIFPMRGYFRCFLFLKSCLLSFSFFLVYSIIRIS